MCIYVLIHYTPVVFQGLQFDLGPPREGKIALCVFGDSASDCMSNAHVSAHWVDERQWVNVYRMHMNYRTMCVGPSCEWMCIECICECTLSRWQTVSECVSNAHETSHYVCWAIVRVCIECTSSECILSRWPTVSEWVSNSHGVNVYVVNECVCMYRLLDWG